MGMPRGFWTAERDAILRATYPHGPVAAAKALGVTTTAAKTRAVRIGVRLRERWTADERAVLRRLFPDHTAEEIAAALPGRSKRSVYNEARKQGLRKLADRDPLLPRVRELHGRGLTDTAIALKLRRELADCAEPRREVGRLRDRLGLKPNAVSILAARRRGARAQAVSLGIRPGGDLRRLAFRHFAEENGWPADLPVRCVQILNVLADVGPRTKNQLAEALGMPWRGRPSRKVLAGRGPGGSYLAHLQRIKFVEQIGRGLRPSKGQGRGRIGSLYVLTPTAIQWREEHGRE